MFLSRFSFGFTESIHNGKVPCSMQDKNHLSTSLSLCYTSHKIDMETSRPGPYASKPCPQAFGLH